MEIVDWFILVSTLAFIVLYGVYKTRGRQTSEEYIKGGDARWWTVGLSVMATQASAITFLSTPGQAYTDGMEFVQFYFGLPIAVIIICVTFIPIYHRLKVYTAYEFLEKRFDLKTRSLASILFLIQRGLAAGITIYAPAIILSAVLDWELKYLNIIIGILVIIYTVSGGTKAVNVTQKQQMIVIMAGMVTAFVLIVTQLPDNVTFDNALTMAGSAEKMQILDFNFSLDDRYNVWSALFGATFLMLSYFGTDQSQVQRYLSGKSVKQMRIGLLFNGLLKVPMQFFILMVGVMVFVFYQFNSTPLNFNPAAEKAVKESEFAGQYSRLESSHEEILKEKQKVQKKYATALNTSASEDIVDYELALNSLRSQEETNRATARTLIEKADSGIETNDKDFVFIHFILHHLPKGLIGLLLAVILSAAMSSTASELNALSSTTTIDIYKRYRKEEKDDDHYVNMSKWFTLMWGLMAIFFASFVSLFDNLIQLVNFIGSIFYGTILGIFLVAFYFKRIKGQAVFIAACISQVIVATCAMLHEFVEGIEILPFLWLNPLGAFLTIGFALLFSSLNKEDRTTFQFENS
ncbi:sodium:solute symporter [Nonlabens sp. MB-3u-79]|jgi:SSS family solute:Na+ symporter|uniref:sodium:solute symporter n=1 Tax=Nonlabens sp. MB-3u-79 TaxID=2058134 RepID=UPI000C30A151|nr:sodium:solute symporter [Nonlabens sp. MB-3u-79]AUC79619.1 sodium:solute symporter [Nonlabens sp. MB-3u-79]|tara:strand:+ start:8363 stop:10093 length:1731 start_codon:yes stop_codon:yes gene_type:complete